MAAQITDKNLPFNCGVCDKLEEGIPAMLAHVVTTHDIDYNALEAPNYVRLWAADKYDRLTLKGHR